jgi:hypothetical protein
MLVEGALTTYFLNLHTLGYLKPVTVFFVHQIWVNKSLSMMCGGRLFCSAGLQFLYW